jgi:hypothetical protein
VYIDRQAQGGGTPKYFWHSLLEDIRFPSNNSGCISVKMCPGGVCMSPRDVYIRTGCAFISTVCAYIISSVEGIHKHRGWGGGGAGGEPIRLPCGLE